MSDFDARSMRLGTAVGSQFIEAACMVTGCGWTMTFSPGAFQLGLIYEECAGHPCPATVRERPPMREMTIKVHEIATDGLPDMQALTGRVAFLWDGNIVNGWPLHVNGRNGSAYTGRWEANSDVGHSGPFEGVTHWVEFPVPVWEIK